MYSSTLNFLTVNFPLKAASLLLAILLFILVNTEKRMTMDGTVRVAFSSPPGKALTIDPPRAVHVSVSGPTSSMQRFHFEDAVPVTIDLKGVPEGFYTFHPGLIRMPAGFEIVDIRPKGFRVQYDTLTHRTLPVDVPVEGTVAGGFRLAKKSITPHRFTIAGPRSIVSQLEKLLTQPVNIDDANDSITARVNLAQLPAGVRVQFERDLQVFIEITPIATPPVERPRALNSGRTSSTVNRRAVARKS